MGLFRPSFKVRDALIGTVLQGRYRVEERIGEGAMGIVYRAVQTPFERDAAIKVLAKKHSKNESIVRRFAAEALIISRLRHPNTLKPYDFGRTPDGRLYIVTEYLQGRTLAQVIEEEGALSPARALDYLGQVCDALTEAHARGIIHRDLKPANVFIERVGRKEVVKVLDFGVAKVVQAESEASGDGIADRTASGTVHGTPNYMSPEQAEGRTVDARSDLYSIGIMAYECITGRPPFTAGSPVAVLLKHVNDQPVPLRDALPGHEVHPDLEGLVLSLLEKDPGQRPSDADEVRRRIEALRRGPIASAGASMPVLSQVAGSLLPEFDAHGDTLHAGPKSKELLSQRQLGVWLRSWFRRSRAARWLLVIGLVEAAVAVALAAWAAGLFETPEFAGPPAASAGAGADGAAAKPPVDAGKKAKKRRSKAKLGKRK